MGLPTSPSPEVEIEAKRLLELAPSLLSSMSAIQCGEAAFCLRQYSWFLQKSLNRERARVFWAEESIKKAIAKNIHKYSGYSFEERKLQATNDNDVASNLEVLKVKSKLKVERLSYLADKIGDMAKSLESLQFTKRGENGKSN